MYARGCAGALAACVQAQGSGRPALGKQLQLAQGSEGRSKASSSAESCSFSSTRTRRCMMRATWALCTDLHQHPKLCQYLMMTLHPAATASFQVCIESACGLAGHLEYGNWMSRAPHLEFGIAVGGAVRALTGMICRPSLRLASARACWLGSSACTHTCQPACKLLPGSCTCRPSPGAKQPTLGPDTTSKLWCSQRVCTVRSAMRMHSLRP